MKALTFAGREDARVASVPEPVLEAPTDAIVGVRLAAVCGSDLHVYHERERGIDPGTTLGHEFVGEVLEVGRGVTALRPGDRLASPFATSCGRCFYCSRGLTSRAARGRPAHRLLLRGPGRRGRLRPLRRARLRPRGADGRRVGSAAGRRERLCDRLGAGAAAPRERAGSPVARPAVGVAARPEVSGLSVLALGRVAFEDLSVRS